MSETSYALPTVRSSLPVTQHPSDRLPDQIGLERELTDRVVAGETAAGTQPRLAREPPPLRGNLDPVVPVRR
jgi:hypothetical protein